MIDPREAWSRLEPYLEPLAGVEIPRRDAAGRVLARPLAATADVPAQDVSAMDGFALTGAPPPGTELPVGGMIVAGDAPGARLAPAGELPGVVRIMTGAPVPAGADRVIPVERSTIRGRSGARRAKDEPVERTEPTELVTFDDAGAPGDHIRRRGEVARPGAGILPAGALLTPGALSLAATHGHGTLTVHRPPRVALVVTGDEVVPPDREPGPGQLRDCQTDFVLAACRTLGIEVEPLGIAPDDPAGLRALAERGLAADVLLLTGGVSMGELDLVEGTLRALGCDVLFHGVAVQPGKPLLAAVQPAAGSTGATTSGESGARRGLVFGLPGNPASVMVGFWLFVRPALRRLLGRADGFWHGALAAELAAPLPPAKARDKFLPSRVSVESGRLLAHPVWPVGSHDMRSYGHGTALVRIPAGSPGLDAGAPCEILPLADTLF